MAEPTSMNSQVTDAVTQTNVKVLSEASSMAMGTLYQTASSSLSIATQNFVANQQQNNSVADTTMAICIDKVLGKK